MIGTEKKQDISENLVNKRMILLGLGSNLPSSFGDRFQNIELAVSALETYKIKLKNKSSFYESFSYPNKKNPKFINIIAEIIRRPEQWILEILHIKQFRL